MAGDAMDGARHSCRFAVRLAGRLAGFQAFATSGVEADECRAPPFTDPRPRLISLRTSPRRKPLVEHQVNDHAGHGHIHPEWPGPARDGLMPLPLPPRGT